MMAHITTEAIVLKSMRWGEADRIVTFFSYKLGKVRGIAREARKMKNRFGGALEPFTCVNLTLLDKRNDSLASISAINILEDFTGLRENLEGISAAARMVSLVEGLTADRDPSHQVFHTLREGLRALVDSEDHILTTLIFQIHVLTHAGFRPQVDHCASCGKGVGLPLAKFSSTAGGLLCPGCVQSSWDYCLPMSSGSIAFVQQARRMRFDLALRLKAEGQVRKELEEIIDTYVRVVVDKPLPAVDFLAAETSPVYGKMNETSVVEKAKAYEY